MPSYVYVASQDDNQIAVFTIDGETGRLTRSAEVPMPGGPSLLAIRPNRQCLYVGHRQVPEISSHRIDPATGALRRIGSITPPDPPGFLATDRRGRYLLVAYYQGGRAGVHPLGEDGAIKDPPSAWVPTAVGAHAIQTDPSNRFAFVPHIARLNDNVLEPPKNAPGPNAIYQFRFDEATGRLTPNTPLQLTMAGTLGPRHYCFHPSQDVVYFSDEQGWKQYEQRGMRAQTVILTEPSAMPPPPFAHSSAPSRCSCGSHRTARRPLGSENTLRSSGAASPCGCRAHWRCYGTGRGSPS